MRENRGMAITGVVVRRRVADLDAAIEFYEALTATSADRFAFSGARLASIGPFLIFAADGELAAQLERVVATVTVDDLDAQAGLLRSLGAEVVAPVTATPNGRRMIARHPDGGVFEYTGP